jgi:hypothetical protein
MPDSFYLHISLYGWNVSNNQNTKGLNNLNWEYTFYYAYVYNFLGGFVKK